jgi:enterochelin esterase-like enzyme
MNKFFSLLSLLLFTLSVNASSVTSELERVARTEYPTDTLYKIWLAQQKDHSAALNFYNALPEKHIVELNENNAKTVTVTYFAKGSADTDYMLQAGGPDFYGLRFKKIDNSHIYFCTQNIPSDAWFTYGVNEFKRTKAADLISIKQTSMVHINDGAVIGPEAPLSEYTNTRQETPKGTLREVVLNSKFMGEQRRIQVYVPANYNQNVTYNLVLQFDGQNYSASSEQRQVWQGWTPMPTILDNLIHQKQIGPTIAIFIHNQGNRSGDLISDQMTDFVALEIVAWARKNFNIASEPKNLVVSGPSRAGFAAANTALRHSTIIGSVLSQSGSFYYTLQDEENWPVYPEFEGKLVLDYKRSAKQDIHFYLDVGLYDLGLGAVGTNRQLRDILELKGYQVDYYQYKGGHSHLGWRHTLANGLISLLGRE